MKKFVSAVLAAAITASSTACVNVFAEKYGDNGSFVVLGDSIASGSGLSAYEYNYGQIAADYTGGSVTNLAVPGDTSGDLAKKLESLSAEEKSEIENAEYVVISAGGNDIIQYAAKELLIFAINNKLANDDNPYTVEQVKALEKLPISNLFDVFDIEKIKGAMNNGAVKASFALTLTSIENNLALRKADDSKGQYKHYIEKTVIPNIKADIDAVKALNPNAKIVVNNLYNVFQLDNDYLVSKLGEGNATLFSNFYRVAKNVVGSFNTQLSEIEGIEVVDVFGSFSAGEENTWMFTGMQADSLKAMDIHPTQAGHLVMASALLDTIGCEGTADGGILGYIYSNLEIESDLPEETQKLIEEFRGSYITGDVNEDGKIDASDASGALIEYAAMSTTQEHTLTDTQQTAADTNGDGSVDAGDASNILGYYARTSTGEVITFRQHMAK